MNPEQNITVIEQQTIYYTCVLLCHYGTHRCCILFTGYFIENSLNVSLNKVLYVCNSSVGHVKLFLALFRSMMHFDCANLLFIQLSLNTWPLFDLYMCCSSWKCTYLFTTKSCNLDVCLYLVLSPQRKDERNKSWWQNGNKDWRESYFWKPLFFLFTMNPIDSTKTL